MIIIWTENHHYSEIDAKQHVQFCFARTVKVQFQVGFPAKKICFHEKCENFRFFPKFCFNMFREKMQKIMRKFREKRK